MLRPPLVLLLACASIAVLGGAGRVSADEGMWTFNQFPKERLKERYGFLPTDGWLDHVRLASVRFNSGGSGSFVSSTGLVMTNHHVGSDCMAKLGASGHDYHRDGFHAKTAADELRCPDLELDVLVGIEEVTAEVTSLDKGLSDADAARAHVEKIAAIEKRCVAAGTSRCDVVTLYRGGRYDLYKYKKYTDVRLVFAPEFAIAFFGGDADNFSYPRYDLDVALFRAYDAGKAVVPAHYFKWSPVGAREGELVFTSGNPGSTSRLATQAMLETYREVLHPTLIADLERQQQLLTRYAERGPDAERDARKLAFSVDNSLKAYRGQLEALKDPALMKKKAAREADMQKRMAAKPELKAATDAWELIEHAQQIARATIPRLLLLEGRHLRSSNSEPNPMNARLYVIARALVRLVDEQAKPSEKRLREYGDSMRPALELWLYSPAPVHLDLEEEQLRSALEQLATKLGAKDPAVKLALAGKTPAVRAKELIRGTKLVDVAFRKQLATGRAAQDVAKDPLVAFARALDPEARVVRKKMEDELEAVEEQGLAQIARAQLALDGPTVPPDATGTLRLSFGKVEGYREGARNIPPFT
ncbi:MAG: S46 family peptidase, partial [Polyangia bacterium]